MALYTGHRVMYDGVVHVVWYDDRDAVYLECGARVKGWADPTEYIVPGPTTCLWCVTGIKWFRR